ncbi:tetratricopeptide repeat protein [Lysobacter sp. S4-A87]|uniref:tetratricopeptide repeat protein n=1 Tax=Lysobacter sp. S4-A87 TaxID=2925843 RepID=UPI001F531995|nr:tetratricopeptide repeat protein [Lysobacter sp. S4-A87]UNK48168.1 tetratricopeptide repeat protein [Lysobacter sp. S4-A87]
MRAAIVPLMAVLGAAPLLPAAAPAAAAAQCELDRAQQLMGQQPQPTAQIDTMLDQCRALAATDYRVDLLTGVRARDDGRLNDAAAALARAHQQAPDEVAPVLELAVTHEFQQRPDKARVLYDQVLQADPGSRPAQLGLARVARQQYRPDEAEAIYRGLLAADPDDRQAQAGMAMVALQQRRYDLARERLQPLQAATPDDPQVRAGLEELALGWRYRLDLMAGREDLSAGNSNRLLADLEIALNARDVFRATYVNNDRELISLDPRDLAVLPLNAGRVSWMRRVPGQFFWEVAYEYRQHDSVQDEQRVELNVGHRLGGRVQGFAGVRQQFGATPAHDRLWHLGLSMPTSAHTYATVVAYFGDPTFADKSTAYVADLTYERERLQLTGGIGYGTDPSNFISHVRGVWPLPRHQAITFGIEHRTLGDETEAIVGWRVEWK